MLERGREIKKKEKMSQKIKRSNKNKCTYLGLVSPTKELGFLIFGTVQGILCIYDSPPA